MKIEWRLGFMVLRLKLLWEVMWTLLCSSNKFFISSSEIAIWSPLYRLLSFHFSFLFLLLTYGNLNWLRWWENIRKGERNSNIIFFPFFAFFFSSSHKKIRWLKGNLQGKNPKKEKKNSNFTIRFIFECEKLYYEEFNLFWLLLSIIYIFLTFQFH